MVSVSPGASVRTPMSYQEFVDLGETKHHEYYDGLCVVNPPNARHALAVDAITDLLKAACPKSHRALSVWGWETPAQEIFEPDVMVCDRSAVTGDLLRRPPLLVVEVSSPSTRSDDRSKKVEAYARAGAGWYWLVDLDVPEVVVLENRDGVFVEAARLRQRGVTPGPVAVELDPGAIG